MTISYEREHIKKKNIPASLSHFEKKKSAQQYKSFADQRILFFLRSTEEQPVKHNSFVLSASWHFSSPYSLKCLQ